MPNLEEKEKGQATSLGRPLVKNARNALPSIA